MEDWFSTLDQGYNALITAFGYLIEKGGEIPNSLVGVRRVNCAG